MEERKSKKTSVLKEAKTSHPHLATLLELDEKIREVRDEVGKRLEPHIAKKISPALVRKKLEVGEPLIAISEMEIDWEAFSLLLQRIGSVLAGHSPEAAQSVEDFVSRYGDDRNSILRLAASQSGEEDEFAQFLVINALKPFLDREREALLPLVDQELWIRRYCPVCGGTPDFSLLEDEVGIRSLVCSRCDAKWRYKRLECPFCGTEDASKLAYYPSKDKTYRLYVCDNCKHYLKALDLRVTPGEPDIGIERLITLDLDIAAQEAEYI